MMEYQPRQFEKPTDDYLRVATISPEVAIADVPANVAALAADYNAARNNEAELIVSPELSLTGYSAADLFSNQYVLEQTRKGLAQLARMTSDGPALIVGAPLEHRGVLYNCAAVLAEGRIAGVVPKVHLPNYKEFYEDRWFTGGGHVKDATIDINGNIVPFGTDAIYDVNGTKVGIEICEDMFAPISPASYSTLAGAEVIVNLSASNELVGKADYRRTLVSAFSGKSVCVYIYCSAGRGESVADVIYGGHQLINEAGNLVAERVPLSDDHSPLVYDIDRTYLQHDRLENQTFAAQSTKQPAFRVIKLSAPQPTNDTLRRKVDPLPFVPSNPETLDRRCEELFKYMSHALAQRLKDAHSQATVIGLSGGLDSTLALLTATEAAQQLSVSNRFIHTITMPGMASSHRTQSNADKLAAAVGTSQRVIAIDSLAQDVLQAIGHDGQTEDITFENTQARYRTMLLMNYANRVGGCVQGTGDMSESAIGWCTFNGDHMSMFNPNAGVPKTLVKHLVTWYAKKCATPDVRVILEDILATPVSPELTGEGDLSQNTDDIVGPGRLRDFFMNEFERRGSRPEKMGYLALQAFGEEYDHETVGKWLEIYLNRHTASQWKRNASPDGTKIGTIDQSPRGSKRMAPNTSANWHK